MLLYIPGTGNDGDRSIGFVALTLPRVEVANKKLCVPFLDLAFNSGTSGDRDVRSLLDLHKKFTK